MAVCPGLCWSSVTLSSTAKKRKEGEKEEKKQLTVEKQVQHTEISFLSFFLFSLFTIEPFCMETPGDLDSF